MSECGPNCSCEAATAARAADEAEAMRKRNKKEREALQASKVVDSHGVAYTYGNRQERRALKKRK